jgi:hypothetical protein
MEMIKAYAAMTREIDDTEAAVAEILEALDIDNNLLKNSVGIITCFAEYDDTGALKAICDVLPFDCLGATTCLCATGGEIDQIMFAITVLTSDDCDFKTAFIPIAENYKESINTAVSELLNSGTGKPSLFLTYLPLLNTISGDMILSAIDSASGSTPLFGTVAVDHTSDYSSTKVIHNGVATREAAALCAVYGDVDFQFEVASLDKEKIRKQKAIITESDGNLLIGVNGKTALEYFEEIGLAKENLASGVGVIPLVIDYMDSTRPVARAVFALTPDGYAVCGGEMPVDATFSIGKIDMSDVLSTTEAALNSLTHKDGVILGYSCMARYLVQGASYTAEAQKVNSVAGETPYLFACSGGEICPLPDSDGNLKNYFHNYTTVFCRLM